MHATHDTNDTKAQSRTLAEPSAGTGCPAPLAAEADDLTEDLLVEEISIDGMCGVY